MLLSRPGVAPAAAVTRTAERSRSPDSLAPVKALRGAGVSAGVHSTLETRAPEFHRRRQPSCHCQYKHPAAAETARAGPCG